MADNFLPSSPVLTASLALARRLTAAQVRALGAIQTANLNLATLPPNTFVKRVLCLINGQAAGVTTLLFSVGYDPGGPYEDYFNQHDLVNDAAGAILGNAPSLSAVSVPCAAIPSVTTPTPIVGVLTCSTGAETFATVTGLDVSIYFECGVLPS